MSGSIFDALAQMGTNPGLMALTGAGGGLAQAAMPTPYRGGVPFGAALGMAAQGMGQGANNAYAAQKTQAEAESAKLQNEMLKQYVGQLPSMLGQSAGGAPTSAQPAAEAAAPTNLFNGPDPVHKSPAVQFAVASTANKLGVDPQWATRVAYAETGSENNPYSATSDKGAVGPMQLMPETAKELGVDPNDPNANIQGGVTYLQNMNRRYGGNQVLATAAYNAGPGQVDDFINKGTPLPAETMKYIGTVFGQDPQKLLTQAGAVPGEHVQLGTTNPAKVMVPTADQTQGLQPVPISDPARAAVKQLLSLRNLAMLAPSGNGWRAVAQIQAALDNMAGPGGIVSPFDYSIYSVPGALQQRAAASQATESGKVAPETQLAANKANINVAETAAKAPYEPLQPVQVPDPANPGGFVTKYLPRGAMAGTSGTISGAITGMPAPLPEQESEAKVTGDRLAKLPDQVIPAAREGANALLRVQQAELAASRASTEGLPPGQFAPELAKAVAAAKSLGVDTSALGIDPRAVSNQQIAHEALTQLSGEMLKRLFPQRITNQDINLYAPALANYGLDPAALDQILGISKTQAQYDVNRSNSMLEWQKTHNNSLSGWEQDFYQKNGYGPQLIDAINTVKPTEKSGQAAAAKPAYREGQTATGPNGAKMVFRNGAWVDVKP